MDKKITFCGSSGSEYRFAQAPVQGNWAHFAGVAIFAVREAYGWRVIKLTELTGRDHDVRPIWAFHDAQRYGADTVFVSAAVSAETRKAMIDDMEAGLDPVIMSSDGEMALAA